MDMQVDEKRPTQGVVISATFALLCAFEGKRGRRHSWAQKQEGHDMNEDEMG